VARKKKRVGKKKIRNSGQKKKRERGGEKKKERGSEIHIGESDKGYNINMKG